MTQSAQYELQIINLGGQIPQQQKQGQASAQQPNKRQIKADKQMEINVDNNKQISKKLKVSDQLNIQDTTVKRQIHQDIRFMDGQLLQSHIYIINQPKVQQIVKQYYRQQISQNKILPFAYKYLQALQLFLIQTQIYFTILMDLDAAQQMFLHINAAQLNRKQQQQKINILHKIHKINIYIKQNDTQNGQFRYKQLQKQCDKICKLIYHQKLYEYLDQAKKYQSLQVSYRMISSIVEGKTIKKICKQTNGDINLLSSFIYLGSKKNTNQLANPNNISQQQRQRIQQKRKNVFNGDKSQITNYQIIIQGLKNIINNVNNTKQRKQCLQLFKTFVSTIYHENQSQKFILNNYINSIDHINVNYNLQNNTQSQINTRLKQNIFIIVLAFYKLKSHFHKTINAMLRISQKIKDFKKIALPFCQLSNAIQYHYRKYLQQKKFNVQQFTVYRGGALQHIQLIQKGMYLCFKSFFSATTDKQVALNFRDSQDASNDNKCFFQILVPKRCSNFLKQIYKNDPGYFSFSKQLHQNKLFQKIMKQNLSTQTKNITMQLEKQVLFNKGCIFEVISVQKVDGIKTVKLKYGAIHELQKTFRCNKQLLNDQQLSIILNYNLLNKKIGSIKNMGDILKYSQQVDKRLLQCKQNYKTNKNDQSLCELIEAQQNAGVLKDSYQINKQYINNMNENINDIINKPQLKEKFKNILIKNEDNLKVQNLLKLVLQKISNKQNKNENQYQISNIKYQRGNALLSQKKIKDSLKQLIQSRNKIYPILINLRKQKNNLLDRNKCSNFIFSKIKQLFISKNQTEQNQQINQNKLKQIKQQQIKYYKLLLKILNTIFKCYKLQNNQHKKLTYLKQTQNQINKINSQYYELIYNQNKSQSLQNKPQSIQNKIQSLKNKNIQQLQQIQQQSHILAIMQSNDLKQNKKSHNSYFNQSIQQLPDHQYNKTIISINNFKNIGQQSCIKSVYCFQKHTTYNYLAQNKQIKYIQEQFHISIQSLILLEGQDSQEVMSARNQFSQYLHQNDKPNKSIQQALKVINKQLAQIHTNGVKAYYLLSLNYFIKGQYNNSYSVVLIGLQILERVKIKQATKKYEQSYKTCDLYIELILMRVKLQNKRHLLSIDSLFRYFKIFSNSSNKSQQSKQVRQIRQMINKKKKIVRDKYLQNKKKQIENKILQLNVLQIQSKCSETNDTQNYVKIHRQIGNNYKLINQIILKSNIKINSNINNNNIKQKQLLQTKREQQFHIVQKIIKMHTGKYNVSLANNYRQYALQCIRRKNKVNQQLIKKSQQFMKQAFQIMSVFPYNHPQNCFIFVLKWQIQRQKQEYLNKIKKKQQKIIKQKQQNKIRQKQQNKIRQRQQKQSQNIIIQNIVFNNKINSDNNINKVNTNKKDMSNNKITNSNNFNNNNVKDQYLFDAIKIANNRYNEASANEYIKMKCIQYMKLKQIVQKYNKQIVRLTELKYTNNNEQQINIRIQELEGLKRKEINNKRTDIQKLIQNIKQDKQVRQINNEYALIYNKSSIEKQLKQYLVNNQCQYKQVKQIKQIKQPKQQQSYIGLLGNINSMTNLNQFANNNNYVENNNNQVENNNYLQKVQNVNTNIRQNDNKQYDNIINQNNNKSINKKQQQINIQQKISLFIQQLTLNWFDQTSSFIQTIQTIYQQLFTQFNQPLNININHPQLKPQLKPQLEINKQSEVTNYTQNIINSNNLQKKNTQFYFIRSKQPNC